MPNVEVSNERIIFAVLAYFACEGRSVLKAFESKSDAEAFRDECTRYEGTRPLLSLEIEDAPVNDAELEQWNCRFKIWKEQHPAKDPYVVGCADGYIVDNLILVVSSNAKLCGGSNYGLGGALDAAK